MNRNARQLTTADEAGIEIQLPDDAWFEYQWRDGEGNVLPAPDNPETGTSIWYGQVNVLRGPAYRPDRLAERIKDAEPKGALRRERLQSDALAQPRRVNTYTPAGFQDAELPAIFVNDGTAFQRVGRLAAALDAVIDGGAAPARLVLLEPVNRDSEYAFSAAYESFVLEELLPQLDDLGGPTSSVSLLGASLGGLSAATLALRAPDRFEAVALFSAALLGSPADSHPYTSRDEWVSQQVEAGAPVPDRWFVGAGTLEWLHAPNERLAAALRAAGTDVAYLERSAGHNWTMWRDMLGAGLRHLLPSSQPD